MTMQAVPEADKAVAANDPRIKLLDRTIRKEQRRPDALIQILHVVQNFYGYLPMEVVRHIAREMRLPPSRIFGVITFYHYFSLKPKGEHTCLVCTGTACYVKGAGRILEAIEQDFGVKPGEVTADNKLGVQVARCIGACGLAPAVVVNDEVLAKVQPEQMKQLIQSRIG